MKSNINFWTEVMSTASEYSFHFHGAPHHYLGWIHGMTLNERGHFMKIVSIDGENISCFAQMALSL